MAFSDWLVPAKHGAANVQSWEGFAAGNLLPVLHPIRSFLPHRQAPQLCSAVYLSPTKAGTAISAKQ